MSTITTKSKEESENLHLGEEGQALKFFSFDELSRVKLTRKTAELLLKNPEDIKVMLHDEKPPLPESLGLE